MKETNRELLSVAKKKRNDFFSVADGADDGKKNELFVIRFNSPLTDILSVFDISFFCEILQHFF